MTNDKELMQQALEALEPVAWRTFDGEGGYDYRSYDDNENYAAEWAQRNPRHVDWVEALYTTPPRREWVGLTDEEMRGLEKKFNAERVRTSDEEYLIIYPGDYWDWQRAIEAKLREKNSMGVLK